MHKLTLKPGREKSLKRRHPWIFSGAIAELAGQPESGETVAVHASSGERLAYAAYSAHSQIRARVWTWDDEAIDVAFMQQRIAAAAARRAALALEESGNSLRLVHAEADGLPGVVADRYGDVIVLQLLSAGADRWRDAIADALIALDGAACVWERSEGDAREMEGLPQRAELLRGAAPTGAVPITEHGVRYALTLASGQKTGFYLDQRDNRRLVRELVRDADVLDCFCYTGGFALNAAAAGARSVLAVDSSGPALAAAREHAQLNAQPGIEWLEADVFQLLRRLRDHGRQFDVIVLDPPKFAPTASHAERAARAYKDINLFAFKLLRPGGALLTHSCSGGVNADLFQKIVAGAALDAGVDARIERWLHAAADHPVALNVPESEYLKGLLCRL
ncbi:MAG TPA: class I SAM-dependent methyltransferase [Burkholderiales bacterium]|nr:class I SAM-dependent methyltransferase [Burkholderiales bacterium]